MLARAPPHSHFVFHVHILPEHLLFSHKQMREEFHTDMLKCFWLVISHSCSNMCWTPSTAAKALCSSGWACSLMSLVSYTNFLCQQSRSCIYCAAHSPFSVSFSVRFVFDCPCTVSVFGSDLILVLIHHIFMLGQLRIFLSSWNTIVRVS